MIDPGLFRTKTPLRSYEQHSGATLSHDTHYYVYFNSSPEHLAFLACEPNDLRAFEDPPKFDHVCKYTLGFSSEYSTNGAEFQFFIPTHGTNSGVKVQGKFIDSDIQINYFNKYTNKSVEVVLKRMKEEEIRNIKIVLEA